jgi:hypothetical protein
MFDRIVFIESVQVKVHHSWHVLQPLHLSCTVWIWNRPPPLTDRVLSSAISGHIGSSSIEHFAFLVVDGLVKSPGIVMPVPDHVRNDGSGIQNLLNILDSAKASLRARLSPE